MITLDEAHRLFRYDPETGSLTWRVKGVEVGGLTSRGYRRTWVGDKQYMVHRIIMLMVNGDWPEHGVDHINGVCDDNRLCNLRLASTSENQRNRKLNSNSKSGVAGVYWHSRIKKWAVQLSLKPLGYRDSLLDAVALRKSAELLAGYHPNHGRVTAQ